MINIWMLYANEREREQMLVHLIDLYVNRIQTFHYVFLCVQWVQLQPDLPINKETTFFLSNN